MSNFSKMRKLLKSKLIGRQNSYTIFTNGAPTVPNGAPIIPNGINHQAPEQPLQRQPTRFHSERQAFVSKPKRLVRKIEPEDLRELCDLIKERHGLDTVIWSLRKSRLPDRKLVEVKMRKADAILSKIEAIVRTFDHTGAFSSTDDFNKFKEIKKRVEANGKRRWMKEPPWDE